MRAFCRYTGEVSKVWRQQIEFTSPAWLHSSGWDHSLPTVLIVHGYGGAKDDYLPGPVLRDGKQQIYTGQNDIYENMYTPSDGGKTCLVIWRIQHFDFVNIN